ncbi:methylamine utilization protein [Inhella gelatinilytica]|uniref:Methylamine utilization protein n=1 Tax=Inhella gelatinilytica TaxID=2795030 RepID=A0A931ITL7_9BURK|nr:methylamine utilization protein [Inhella gelatinilytica]MBH9551904.1 methylamine utilization protein [Inhella gelatinilytica]
MTPPTGSAAALPRLPNRWRPFALGMIGWGVAAASSATDWQLELRDADGAPAADAVVAIEVRGLPKVARNARAEMVQKDRQFLPRVLVVQTGTAVSFPNLDTVRHHVYSFSPIKPFDLKLYHGTPAEPVRFDRAGVAVLGCNIHDRMAAHIVVVDTPVFGQTDAQGRVTLELPPGEHTVRVWRSAWDQRWWSHALVVRADAPPNLRLQLPARP